MLIIITCIIILAIMTQVIIHISNLQDEAKIIRMKKETQTKHNQTKQKTQ